MAAPKWITKAGSLGIAVELKPFTIDINTQTGNARATFAVISGNLPPGLRLSPRGNISGYPVGKVSGVPLAVNEEVTSTFTVRCTNERGELADRTFSITITGENPPEPFIPTTPLSLGQFLDGAWIDVDVTAFDSDPGDILSYTVINGRLPPGLHITQDGHITGYGQAAAFISQQTSFDTNFFDQLTQGFDFSINDDKLTFNFDMQISDGKIPVVYNYSITLINTLTVQDHYVPLLVDRSIDLGAITDQNYYYKHFDVNNFEEGASVNFEILPNVRYVTVKGTMANPTLSNNSNFSINGIKINISISVVPGPPVIPNVQDVADSINASSQIYTALANVFAQVVSGHLWIYITDSAITITDGVNTPLASLGITAGTFNRNPLDLGFSASTDPTEPVPQTLSINAQTGWLYGYVNAISLGRKTYDFTLRVYNPATEPAEIVATVDYATDLPFTLIHNQPQSVLNSLGLTSANADFTDKTIIFVQPDQYAETYYTLPTDSVGSPTTSDFGWHDTANGNAVIPGYEEALVSPSTTKNKRAGIWKFVYSGGIYTLELQSTVSIGQVIKVTKYKTESANSYNQYGFRMQYFMPSVWSPTTAYSIGDHVTYLNHAYVCSTPTGPDGVFPIANFTLFVPTYVVDTRTNPYSSYWAKRLVVNSSQNYQFDWHTDSDLGVITSGMPCKLQINASTAIGSTVQYHIASSNLRTVQKSSTNSSWFVIDNINNIIPGMTVYGDAISGTPTITEINTKTNQIRLSIDQTLAANSILYLVGRALPRGLRLTSDGFIQGRPSHQRFHMLDNTTFDKTATTFDQTYIINVTASTNINDPAERTIEDTRSFILKIVDYKVRPSCNLYLEFLLSESDRKLITNATFDRKLIPDENIYRLNDQWFGRKNDFRMLIAYGVDSPTDSQLAAALTAYHHKQKVMFTELRWAQSIGPDGKVEYEIIYLATRDMFTLPSGISLTGPIVTITGAPITDDSTAVDASNDDTVDISNSNVHSLYPASIPNAQAQLRNTLGSSVRNFLPGWMTSHQPDNRILNYTPAIPLLYLKPGFGKLALYKLQTQQNALNPFQIDAITDRYYWDDALAINYDKNAQQFINDAFTSFDQQIVDTTNINILTTVDLAVTVPFYQVNQIAQQTLLSNGTLDGFNGLLDGKTIIFVQQQNFTGLPDYQLEDGWVYVNPQFDDTFGDQYETFGIVPGFNEAAGTFTAWNDSVIYFPGDWVSLNGVKYQCLTANGPLAEFPTDFFAPILTPVINQRAGLWRISVDDGGVVALTFVQEIPATLIAPWNSVRVRSGITWGGKILSLVPGPMIGPLFNVPGYSNQIPVDQAANTRFDTTITNFFASNTDSWTPADDGAKYAIFAKQYFIEKGIVDV